MKYYLLEGTFVDNHPTGDSLKKGMTVFNNIAF